MANIAVVHRTIQGVEICQREKDGYFNATNMCQALKKQWHDFHRLNSTKAFIEALSTEAVKVLCNDEKNDSRRLS